MTETNDKGPSMTPQDWCDHFGVTILDPDGWRYGSPYGCKSFFDPLNREDFLRRYALSTATIMPSEKGS